MKVVCIGLLLLVVVPLDGLYLELFHPNVWKVVEDTQHNLTLSLRLNASDEVPPGLDADTTRLAVRLWPEEDWRLDMANDTVTFSLEEVLAHANKTLQFSGYYWGNCRVAFMLVRNDIDPAFTNETLLRDDFTITIDRGSIVLDMAFIGVGSVFMLINNVNMGAQLDLPTILQVLRKPLGPLCGFLSQFICMPLLSFLLGWLFFGSPLHRLGLFTLGCCPGGTMSNFWTLMYNGDINLSITMTAVSTVAAMGMMPLWMFTLGKKLLSENDDLQVPFANLAASLVSLTLPIGIGLIIRHKRPAWADKGARILKPFTLCIIMFFMTAGIYNSYKAFLLMTWQMAVAGLFLAASGYLFGAVFAFMWCLSKDQVIAISIETALQNPGVAFILLKLSLPSPDSDLAALPVVATIMATGPPLMLLYALLMAVRCCLRPRESSSDTVSPVEAGEPSSQPFISPSEGDKPQMVLEGLTKTNSVAT